MYGIPPGPRGSLLLLSGEDAMYGASSVHHVQLNNKRSFDDYTSHTIFNIIHSSGIVIILDSKVSFNPVRDFLFDVLISMFV